MKTRLHRLFFACSFPTIIMATLFFMLALNGIVAGHEMTPSSQTFTSPIKSSTSTTYTTYLPMVQKSYEWHKVGGALATGNTVKATQVFTGYQNYWYHQWGLGCDDVRDPTGSLGRHVPMVRSGTITTFLTTVQYGPCNDGRPILVLNEPEQADQDNSTPTQTLYIITSVVNSSWQGPVYVGGILIQHEDYISKVLTIWANSHNGSRLIPGVAGFHVHPYLNFVSGYSPWLTATQFMPLVDQNVQMVRDFIAHREAEGYAGSIIISEFGWLGTTVALGRRDSDMVAVFDRYVQDFDTIPEIQGWAWFSDWCPADTNPNDYNLSNLVYDDGTLTPTGAEFRAKLGVYP